MDAGQIVQLGIDVRKFGRDQRTQDPVAILEISEDPSTNQHSPILINDLIKSTARGVSREATPMITLIDQNAIMPIDESPVFNKPSTADNNARKKRPEQSFPKSSQNVAQSSSKNPYSQEYSMNPVKVPNIKLSDPGSQKTEVVGQDS